MTLHPHDASRVFDLEPARNNSIVTRLWTAISGRGTSLSLPTKVKTEDCRTTNGKFAGRALRGAPLLLALLWIYTLWWGEQAIFQRQVKGCSWEDWESWVSIIAVPRFLFRMKND